MNNQLIKALGPIVVIIGVIVLSLYHFTVLPQENSVLVCGGALLVLGVALYVILTKRN